MSAHTPGPWEHNAQAGVVRSTSAGFVADVSGVEPRNIRLIVAAPELLAACESLLDDDSCECWNSGEGCRHDTARAAIAKARGQ